jgi:hypothetical protein
MTGSRRRWNRNALEECKVIAKSLNKAGLEELQAFIEERLNTCYKMY